MRKGFMDFLASSKPDVVCLQEIKINEAARIKENFDFKGYDEYWNSAERPGYSGTAILVKSQKSIKSKVVDVMNGLGIEEFDCEGRLQTLEFDKFYLLNIYFPNANGELSRLDYKEKFNEAFLKYVKKLEKKKPVIATGDFNVAHQEIDLKNPKPNVGNAGFTDEEREWMDKFLASGLVDVFREKYPEKIQYSWWSYRHHDWRLTCQSS